MVAPALEDLCFQHEGVKLHAVAAGPIDGPVVVLLHGFPEFWRGWHLQIPLLVQAGYRVIVPDQRGYNTSDKPLDVVDYRLDRLAGDVVGLLDHLGVSRACIAGHDFGASVAWWVAAFHPDRVRSVAVLNVPHPKVMQKKLQGSLRQMLKSWYMFFFQLPGVPEWWFARKNFRFGERVLLASSRRGTFGPADLEAYRRAWSEPGAVRAMIHWYRAAFRFRLPETTSAGWRVSPPVLILWGEDDRFLSVEMARESLGYCARGRCVLLPGVSHWIQHEEPARVADELIRHFSTTPEREAPMPPGAAAPDS